MEAAKERERRFKNRQQRLETLRSRVWKTSSSGNLYLKSGEHIAVICRNRNGRWKYFLDNILCREVFETQEEAKAHALEALADM